MTRYAAKSMSAMEGDFIDPAARAAARRYIDAATGLADRSFWGLRMTVGVNLFLWHLDAFAAEGDPLPRFLDAFDRASALLEAAGGSGVTGGHFPGAGAEAMDDAAIEARTSGMFSDVWVDLTDEVYFEESYRFLRTRMEANGVDPEALFAGKRVLDAGCGSGKFAAAIARLGARQVVGMDIGERGLDFARRQAAKAPYGDRLDYAHGSAHDIPFPDGSFDMVWSNGVIHLTADYDGCVAEFARVIRPDGDLFLYVNGRFGLYELLFDAMRLASEDIPAQLYQDFLFSLGINSGRVYWMMCAYYGPYQWRAKREVEALLRDNGFTDLRQLTRGLDLDQIELVSRGVPFAAAKYGEAQLKYLARRSA